MKKELTQILKNTKVVSLPLSKIKFLSNINREVNDKHVEKIQKGILKLGEFLGVFIVAKHPTGDYYVVLDGQHRFKAFEGVDQSLKVNCIVSKAKDLSDIVDVMKLLNSNASKWTSQNYVNAFAGLGNKSYKILKEALKDNTLTVSTLPMLMTLQSRSATKEAIESGNFMVINKDWEKNLEQIKEILNVGIIERNGGGSRQRIQGVVEFVISKEYKHERFIANLKREKLDNFQRAIQDKESGKVKAYLLEIQGRAPLKKVA